MTSSFYIILDSAVFLSWRNTRIQLYMGYNSIHVRLALLIKNIWIIILSEFVWVMFCQHWPKGTKRIFIISLSLLIKESAKWQLFNFITQRHVSKHCILKQIQTTCKITKCLTRICKEWAIKNSLLLHKNSTVNMRTVRLQITGVSVLNKLIKT